MEQDEQHLNILSILHYVYAGLAALFVLVFGGIYVFIGIAMLSIPATPARGQPPPPPPEVGWVFIGIAVAAILVGWIVAALVAVAGRFLARRQHWLFCLVIACLICLNMPIGTLLGVFTIIVLVRPTVKQMFEAMPARLVD